MELAIFDMDGTLLDSMWAWYDSPNRVIESLGFTPDEECRDLFRNKGYSGAAKFIVSHFGLDIEWQKVKRMLHDSVIPSYYEGLEFKPGAREYLENLKEKGIRCCILTSNSHEILKIAENRFHLDRYFEDIWTIFDYGMKKSDRDIYSVIEARTGISRKDMVLFEDYIFAIEAAGEAGLRTVGILEDCNTEYHESMKAAATRTISSYQELLDDDIFR